MAWREALPTRVFSNLGTITIIEIVAAVSPDVSGRDFFSVAKCVYLTPGYTCSGTLPYCLRRFGHVSSCLRVRQLHRRNSLSNVCIMSPAESSYPTTALRQLRCLSFGDLRLYIPHCRVKASFAAGNHETSRPFLSAIIKA